MHQPGALAIIRLGQLRLKRAGIGDKNIVAAAGQRAGFSLHLDYQKAGAQHYLDTGVALPDSVLDICDRAVAPGCPASVPGGLQAWELRALVRALATDPRVRSADIVEVDATADAPDGRTVRLSALCVLELLAGLHARKGSR